MSALLEDLKKRMEGALHAFSNDLKGLRTGRASSSLLENITVEAYGNRSPLNQVASVSVPEPRMISVQVWDNSLTATVEKAIANAGLGLNPSSAGNLIRVPIPDLSEERRKELVKVASQYAEQSRVSIRNVRRDGMDTLKKQEKDGEISKDEHHGLGEKVQKLTDDYIKKVDQHLQSKEQEILET